MSKARVSVNKNKMGRPATGIGQMIGVRLHSEDLQLLDQWILANDPEISRPEAMRRILRSVA
ncbi:hypothetical protein EKN06_12375 [Croceicoccus ponticola]|uniref:Uncharacterized protein n=1 Tax=Croceicoccus ponticola TaxID=2217664 RepID=A0A437GVA0_9SPHN|nr:hypothetical protein [Croceicoccus ponticola]RVQ65724.1 hypothetical protein EKN06_12375 [Croceicoccus ponticola]